MNKSELKAVYRERLKPRIKSLESLRLQAKFMGLLMVACFGGISLLPHLPLSSVYLLIAVAVSLMAGIFFFGYKTYVTFKSYRRLFKEGVVKELVRLVDPSFTYRRDQGIDQHTYRTSKLFLKRFDRYTTDDEIKGHIGSVSFEMAEVHTQYETRDSKNRRRFHDIFHGLFFHANFPKAIKGETVVLPDQAQKFLGTWLGHVIQDYNPLREDLIKLENPDFEKAFVIYGTDQIESRYILTPKLMERILQFKKQVKRPLYLSFQKQHLFLAVAVGALFEPPMISRPPTYRDMVRMVEAISLATEIVTQLELNTQLWKEAG